MQIAYWPDSLTESVPRDAQRIYLGDEACISRIPPLLEMIDAVHRLRDSGMQITLVTPFLTENDMHRIGEMIEAISESLSGYEVVCNDWGLLQWLSESRVAEPILGRLLVGQATDPRLAAFDLPERQLAHKRCVRHADGTRVELRYRRPTDALMTHLRGCSNAAPEVLSFLHGLGVRRLEVSNTLQGIYMTRDTRWNVTLHLPDVPIAIARHCWCDGGNQWLHATFPVALYQHDNMVFYRNDDKPLYIDALGIDRLVYRRRECRRPRIGQMGPGLWARNNG